MRRFPVCLAVAALTACVPRTTPPPPLPAPAPQPTPAPSPPPAPPRAPPVAWQDAALAPGDWSYTGAGGPIPQAVFASPGGMLFALRCDPGRQVRIFRLGVLGGPITIVTSFGQRIVPGAGNEDQALATLPASDPLFDQIAFSRGRFLVQVASGGDLVLPSWPEPARLIEECRG